jgi:hypothetical protein
MEAFVIFYSKKYLKKFSAAHFFQFLVKDWIRIGIQPKMLDPDPYQMNTDPKPSAEVPYGSAEPDPYQNITDPQHCQELTSLEAVGQIRLAQPVTEAVDNSAAGGHNLSAVALDGHAAKRQHHED